MYSEVIGNEFNRQNGKYVIENKGKSEMTSCSCGCGCMHISIDQCNLCKAGYHFETQKKMGLDD